MHGDPIADVDVVQVLSMLRTSEIKSKPRGLLKTKPKRRSGQGAHGPRQRRLRPQKKAPRVLRCRRLLAASAPAASVPAAATAPPPPPPAAAPPNRCIRARAEWRRAAQQPQPRRAQPPPPPPAHHANGVNGHTNGHAATAGTRCDRAHPHRTACAAACSTAARPTAARAAAYAEDCRRPPRRPACRVRATGSRRAAAVACTRLPPCSRRPCSHPRRRWPPQHRRLCIRSSVRRQHAPTQNAVHPPPIQMPSGQPMIDPKTGLTAPARPIAVQAPPTGPIPVVAPAPQPRANGTTPPQNGAAAAAAPPPPPCRPTSRAGFYHLPPAIAESLARLAGTLPRKPN